MKKLRLLLTEECNRRCKGCCNKDFDLKALPVCTDYSGYDIVMLTGGEPMLDPLFVHNTAEAIRKQNKKCKIYLYTAKCDNESSFLTLLYSALDGVTLTLHTPKDLEAFKNINHSIQVFKHNFRRKSLRLNVFKGISLAGLDVSNWIVKKNITWIKNCPLPEDEVFMRIN
jgi:molybdenum cofactor biosynthesis enzyme MoaA